MQQEHHKYRISALRIRLARVAALPLFALSVLLLAGCGLPDSFARGSEKRVVIAMSDQDRFDPPTLTIPVGTTVVWENVGDGPHTATLVTGSSGAAMAIAEATPFAGQAPSEDPDAWNSGDLYPGETWQMTFEQPGDYLFICQRHGHAGMMGVVRVWDPDAS